MRTNLTALLLVLLHCYLVSTQTLDCPAGWVSSQADKTRPCYLITNKLQRAWQDAQTFCSQMGGFLWKIDNLVEKTWVYNLLKVYHGYYPTHTEWWIGLHDNPAQTGVIWTDKTQPNMQLLQWVPGEPQQYDHAKACVQYYNGSLRHEDCQQNKYFICERPRSSAVFCDARHNWESISSSCFKVVTQLRTWDDARAECQKEDADLMIVRDGASETILMNFIESRKTDMWIGLRAFKSSTTQQYEYHWQTSTGTKLDEVNSFWSSSYSPTSTALQTVTSSSGNLSCVIANHTIAKSSSTNFWEPANCGIGAFGLCQKSIGRCASGWISHRGNCYQVVSRYHTSWTNANNYCKQQDADLLTIPFGSTQIYINLLLQGLKGQGISSIWIGLSDTETDGTWKWSNGRTVDYTNYGSSTPQNIVNTPDCFQIFTDDVNSTWQIATSCNVNNSFICQIGQGQSPKLPTPPPGAATTRPQPSTTQVPVTWSTDCGPMWVKDSVSNYCYKFNDNTLTWDQAQADCKSQGAQLTSISNYHEERFISDHLFGYTSPALWIGMNSLNIHQGYHWIDGAGFGYINWAPGEPNNVGNSERCGEIIAAGVNMGKWNDVPCDQKRSYVCKRKSIGEPNNANYNEHCAEIIPDGYKKGKWNDNNCNQKRGYICKKPAKDFPTTPAPTTPSVPAGKIYGCPGSDWYAYKTNCYLVKQTSMSWSDARSYCRNRSTELASIADENEQNFVFSQLPRVTGYRDQFWIGLNDMDIQMKFEWTDNSTVTYSRWAEHEPNNYQNRPEDCVTIIQRDGMWNDEMCENPKQGFVCKVPKSIQPSNIPQMVTNTGCPQAGYVAYGYHCYKVMTTAMLPWSEALSSCIGSGGTLAVITDQYQQAFLASQISGLSGYFWIGLTNSGSPYQWVDKSNLAYTSWSSNHTGNEVDTCVAMKSQGPGVGLWVNVQCPGRLRFICQTSRSGFSTPLIVTTTTVAPPTCPNDWQDYNGYCYKAFNDDLKSYFDARESCRSMGADLLSVHSSGEESFAFSYSVRGYSYAHYTYWIGLNDFDVEKGYKWSDGTAFNYTNWASGEPNDSGGTDDCVEYNIFQRSWNDNSCYLSKPYVCKLKKGQHLRTTLPTLPPTDAPECGSLPGWKYFNGSCYYINTPETGPGSRQTWFDGRQYCLSQGADLASVHSIKEAGFITLLISRTIQSDVWIGLNDLGVDQFGWTDGTPFDFMHWNGGEPNDAFGSEKCGQVIHTSGYWNDNDCNEKYHFICKRPQGTLSTVIPSTIKPPVGGCPNGYTRVTTGGRCYKLFASRDNNQRLNYTQARDQCRTYGASYDLAGINSLIELDTLINMVDGQILDDSDVWIGLSDLNNNDRFTWQDSSQLNSYGFATNWDKSQPQRSGGQCVVMATDSRHAGKWKNIACSNTRPYICETRQDPSISIPSTSSMCKKAGFVERNMDCYKLVTTPMSWNDAEQYCTQQNTHLTSILTVYEHAFVDTLAGSVNSPVWIGMSDLQATGTYTWSDQNRIIYTKWGKDEPTYTQYGDGRCVSSYNGYWNDTQCSNTYPFVCKDPFFKPPITNTTYPGYCKEKTWKQNGNFCYFVNLNGGLTYSAAEQDCTQRGMHLTSVDSRMEEIFILGLIDADPNDSVDVWIGFRRKGGFFSWSDGSSPSYMNWARSPQNNDCVMMHHTDGKWEDDSCTNTKGYICKTNKLPATSPPPTTSTTPTTPTTSTTPTTTSSTTTQTTQTPVQEPSSSSSSNIIIFSRSTIKRQTLSPNGVPLTVNPNGPPTKKVTIPRPGYQQQQQGSSSDLTGGQVSGIVVGVLALLVIICAGLLFYRKRHGGLNVPFKPFSNGSTSDGLVNASYDSNYDKVSINGTNGSVKYANGNNSNHANGDSIGFMDA